MSPSKIGALYAATAFSFFAIAINVQPHGWRAWYRLAYHGETAEAKIIGLQPEAHQSCSFKYTVRSHDYQSSDSGCHARIGEVVTVTYLPDDPAFATVSSPKDELAFIVLGPLVMSAVAGILSAWRVSTRVRSESKR